MAHSLFPFRSLLKRPLLRACPGYAIEECPFPSPLTLSSPYFIFLHSSVALTLAHGFFYSTRVWVGLPESPGTRAGLLTQKYWRTKLILCLILSHTRHFPHFLNTQIISGLMPCLSHLSPVDSFLQQVDHVLTLTARSLEAFSPLEENALKNKKKEKKITQEQGWGYQRRAPGLFPYIGYTDSLP